MSDAAEARHLVSDEIKPTDEHTPKGDGKTFSFPFHAKFGEELEKFAERNSLHLGTLLQHWVGDRLRLELNSERISSLLAKLEALLESGDNSTCQENQVTVGLKEFLELREAAHKATGKYYGHVE